ncbi:hypothetical protein GQX74_004255 [Glossina fuscipes]|nr:hypothetical protein GQX74_004255 [Glossina fuscipes]
MMRVLALFSKRNAFVTSSTFLTFLQNPSSFSSITCQISPQDLLYEHYPRLTLHWCPVVFHTSSFYSRFSSSASKSFAVVEVIKYQRPCYDSTIASIGTRQELRILTEVSQLAITTENFAAVAAATAAGYHTTSVCHFHFWGV